MRSKSLAEAISGVDRLHIDWRKVHCEPLKAQNPERYWNSKCPAPPDELCFKSDHLLLLCNNSDIPWVDPAPHVHRESDEAYMVLRGTIALNIGQDRVIVSAGEICFVPAGVAHAVVNVEVPYRGFVIRAPALSDKVYVD